MLKFNVVLAEMAQNMVRDIKPHPYIGKIVKLRGIALASTIGLCLTTTEQQIDAAWEREIGMNIHPLFSPLLELVRGLLWIFLMWCLRWLNWTWHETLSNRYQNKYSLLNIVCNTFFKCLPNMFFCNKLLEHLNVFCCLFMEVSRFKHLKCVVRVLSLQEVNYPDYLYCEWASCFSRSCKQPYSLLWQFYLHISLGVNYCLKVWLLSFPKPFFFLFWGVSFASNSESFILW